MAVVVGYVDVCARRKQREYSVGVALLSGSVKGRMVAYCCRVRVCARRKQRARGARAPPVARPPQRGLPRRAPQLQARAARKQPLHPRNVTRRGSRHHARAPLRAVRQVLHGVEKDLLATRLAAQTEKGVHVVPEPVLRGDNERGDKVVAESGPGGGAQAAIMFHRQKRCPFQRGAGRYEKVVKVLLGYLLLY